MRELLGTGRAGLGEVGGSGSCQPHAAPPTAPSNPEAARAGKPAGQGERSQGLGFSPAQPVLPSLLRCCCLPSHPGRRTGMGVPAPFPRGACGRQPRSRRLGLSLCHAGDAGQNCPWERTGATRGAAGWHGAALPLPAAARASQLRSVLPRGSAGHVIAVLACPPVKRGLFPELAMLLVAGMVFWACAGCGARSQESAGGNGKTGLLASLSPCAGTLPCCRLANEEGFVYGSKKLPVPLPPGL